MAYTITTRSIKESDYDDYLSEWWKDWEWDPIPRDFLPNNGTGGIIVEVDNVPVCAGFLYTTNSMVSWVDWIISTKSPMKKGARELAISMLLSKLTDAAKRNGSKYIYALLKHNKLIKKYEALGYIKGDAYNHEMIKVL